MRGCSIVHLQQWRCENAFAIIHLNMLNMLRMNVVALRLSGFGLMCERVVRRWLGSLQLATSWFASSFVRTLWTICFRIKRITVQHFFVIQNTLFASVSGQQKWLRDWVQRHDLWTIMVRNRGLPCQSRERCWHVDHTDLPDHQQVVRRTSERPLLLTVNNLRHTMMASVLFDHFMMRTTVSHIEVTCWVLEREGISGLWAAVTHQHRVASTSGQ